MQTTCRAALYERARRGVAYPRYSNGWGALAARLPFYDGAADVYNPALGFGDGGGVELEAFRRTQPTARGKPGRRTRHDQVL